jgi:hypothetical protein
MTTPLCLGARQARLTGLRDYIDTGGGSMWFCTGSTLPATPDDAITDTVLGAIPLDSPSGSVSSSGTLATYTLTVPRTALVVATGIVGWVRFCRGDGTGVLDVPVVKAPLIGPVILSDTQVYAGGELQLLSCVITE